MSEFGVILIRIFPHSDTFYAVAILWKRTVFKVFLQNYHTRKLDEISSSERWNELKPNISLLIVQSFMSNKEDFRFFLNY